jgi:hypothetical protein
MNVQEMFAQSFRDELRKEEIKTGYAVEDFKVGGRKTKARPFGEDVEFWLEEGVRQIQGFIDWYEDSGWSIATLDDRPAIEWEAEVSFGGRPVRMVVDAVLVDKAGDLVIVDHKTGNKTPSSSLQLALYGAGIRRSLGIDIKYGSYFMTRKSELSGLEDLHLYDEDWFDSWFASINKQIDMNIFVPSIDTHCGWCSVSEYCAAVGGSKSSDYPLMMKKGNK